MVRFPSAVSGAEALKKLGERLDDEKDSSSCIGRLALASMRHVAGFANAAEKLSNTDLPKQKRLRVGRIGDGAGRWALSISGDDSGPGIPGQQYYRFPAPATGYDDLLGDGNMRYAGVVLEYRGDEEGRPLAPLDVAHISLFANGQTTEDVRKGMPRRHSAVRIDRYGNSDNPDELEFVPTFCDIYGGVDGVYEASADLLPSPEDVAVIQASLQSVATGFEALTEGILSQLKSAA